MAAAPDEQPVAVRYSYDPESDGEQRRRRLERIKRSHGLLWSLGLGQNIGICVEEKRQITPGPSTGAVIGGILGALIFIGIIIGIIFFICKRREDGEGPPKHKPPPPVKAGSSTEMLNKPLEPPTATETAPLSPGEVYYEPTGGEPVTNLDDDATGALNGGAQPVLDDSAKYDVNELHAPDGHHGNNLDPSNCEPPAANISRGESFVSPAMYV